MCKILHISDLHICTEDRAKQLETLQQPCTNLLRTLSPKTHLDIEIHNADYIRALIQYVTVHQVEAICITGDITTFGDPESFELAKTSLFDPLTAQDIPVIVCPGNHDTFYAKLHNFLHSDQFGKINSFAASRWKKWAMSLASIKTPAIKTNIQECKNLLMELNAIEKSPETYGDVFSEYHTCATSSCLQTDHHEINVTLNKRTIKIGFFSFNTVDEKNSLVNLGVSAEEEVNRLVNRLRSIESCDIKIVLMHHNPFSSPDIVEHAVTFGFNGMPSASALMHLLQQQGVDIVLYGHQHTCNHMNIHYPNSQGGRVSLIGCASSATGSSAKANLLDITDSHEAFAYELVAQPGIGSTQFVNANEKPFQLVLEPKTSPDIVTASTRREIREYRWATHSSDATYLQTYGRLWNDCLNHIDIKSMSLLGPRQEELGGIESIKRLTNIMEDSNTVRINIIIHDPNIHSRLDSLSDDDKDILNKITGDYYDWKNMAQAAANTITNLEKMKNGLGDDAQHRIRIIKTPILLSTGIRHVVRNNGDEYIIVRLIPVGVKKQKPVIIKLRQRKDNGMYQFYINYLNSISNNT